MKSLDLAIFSCHHDNVCFLNSGLVHRDIRARHLSLEPVVGLPHPEDRSGNGAGRRGRRRHGAAHQTVRRVPSIHQEAPRYSHVIMLQNVSRINLYESNKNIEFLEDF